MTGLVDRQETPHDDDCANDGCTTWPFWVTSVPFTTSSLVSILSTLVSLSTMGVMKFKRLRANSDEASVASSPARLAGPTIFTPYFSTTLPNSDNGQLPPCSTAMSTITEPGFMVLTMSSLTSTGALRPGISAVVITMSWLAMCSATSAACLVRYSALISLA